MAKRNYKRKHVKEEYMHVHVYLILQGTYNKEKRQKHWYQMQKAYKPLMGGWEGGQAQ